MKTYLFFTIILSLSVACYGVFWIWAIIHAAMTPKATMRQRWFWAGSMFVNPTTAIWYWYIWKRWAFWLLFTPLLGAFISLPFVVRSLLSNAAATKLTNSLFALGNPRLVIILAVMMVFPLILRLAALLHLGKNSKFEAWDRNDWVVALALPIFGFGAGLAYTAKYQRTWALVSLGWWMAFMLSSQFIFANITQALIPAGDERRVEYKAEKILK